MMRGQVSRRLLVGFAGLFASVALVYGASAKIPPKSVSPSFDCAKARKGSIDAVICASRELSILDRTMGQDYKRALAATHAQKRPVIADEQREFIANRNLCMKVKPVSERHGCIAFSYESRIQRLAEWIDGTAWGEAEAGAGAGAGGLE